METFGAEATQADSVELVLFEVAGRTFAADASEVVRIGNTDADARPSPLLGTPRNSRRCLVVASSLGLSSVPIDAVIGMRRTDVDELRRMPAFAQGLVSAALLGFLLDGEQLVLLIDLTALVKEEADPLQS